MKPLQFLMNKVSPIPCTACVLMLLASSAFCREKDWDTVPPRHHRIQIDPLALIGGAIAGNYEFRLNRHHAAVIEGVYQFPILRNEGYQYGGMYRYYYRQHTFWGLFAKTGAVSSTLPSPDRGDTTTYTLMLSFLSIGPQWGRSWYIANRFPLTCRIGMGLPVKNESSWKDGREYPAYPRLIETVSRLATFLDSELTLGVSF